jgi:hypothetical protein
MLLEDKTEVKVKREEKREAEATGSMQSTRGNNGD